MLVFPVAGSTSGLSCWIWNPRVSYSHGSITLILRIIPHAWTQ